MKIPLFSIPKHLLTLFFSLVFAVSWGQINYSVIGSIYTQNFDKLSATAAPSAAITAGSFNNVDPSLNGWYFYENPGDTAYRASDGSANTGDTYSFGVTSNTERALGGIRSGSAAPVFGLYIKNTTGKTISSLEISYTGEQWRLGAQAREDRLDFQYSTSATSLSSVSWTDVNLLDFVAPITAGTVGRLNGNLAANKTTVSQTITGLSIANNSTVFIRWVDFDSTGADDALGIDDFSIRATESVPVPSLTVPSSVSNLDYVEGNGPSVVKTFTLSGSALHPNTGNNFIYIQSPSASSNFEVDADGDNTFTEGGEYFSFLENTFSQTVQVRLKSGLPANVTAYSENYTVDYYNDANAPYQISKTINFSGTVTSPPSPIVSYGNNWSNTVFSYPLGTGPSGNRSATISGTNLTGDVSVQTDNSAVWEVSTDGITYSSSVTYTQTGGTIGTGQRIYVRLKGGLSVASYTGTLTATSAGAVPAAYNLSGEVRQPVITLNVTDFSLFTYAEGQGPSEGQTVELTGTDLAGAVTVSVPTHGNWELSRYADFDQPNTTITINKNTTNNNLSAQPVPILVRLKQGLPAGHYDFPTTDEFQVTSINAVTVTRDLKGTVTAPVPFINVRALLSPNNPTVPGGGNPTNTPSSLQNTLFAAQTLGNFQTKEFIIENLGGAALTVNSITLEGDNPGDFRIDNDNVDSIPSPVSFPIVIPKNSSVNFPVTFAPNAIGVKNAIVIIDNGSSNKPLYRYNIRGTGENAEINIKGNTVDIPNGNTIISTADNTFIGYANSNTANPTTASQQFIVENLGNIPLTVSAITISGDDAADFSVSPANLNIAAGANGTFTVTFAPASTGVKNVVINLANNDVTGNENPYTFSVQGNATSFVNCAPGDPTIIKLQDFDTPSNSLNWTYSISPTGSGATGTVYVGTYPTPVYGEVGTTSLSAIGTKSFIITNRAQDNSYLLLSPVNLTTYTNASLRFKLASFGATAGNGNDDNDWIAVETNDGSGWKQKILISGAPGIASQTKWSFTSGTAIAQNEYTNLLASFAPTRGGYVTTEGYGTVILKNLPSISNLQIRIRGSNGGNEIWSVDNIELYREGPGAEKTWNGTAWSGDGSAPTSNQKAIITGFYNTNDHGELEVCACQITNTGSLLVGNNAPVIIHNELVNEGSLTVSSDANLIQINGAAVNSGNATVKRNSSMKRLDYTYWGTPVEGQTLKTFSPNTVTNRFYSYNEADDSFSIITPLTNPMVKGQGYVIRAPNNFTTALQTWPATFTGKPNNGTVEVAVTKLGAGKNLVGNPYPSNIDLTQLTSDNSTVLTGTYYFWTNNATWESNTGGIGTIGNYNGNGYAAWNGSGGVQATSGEISVGAVPTRYVKPGQGFLAEASQTGTVSFKNGIRTKDGGASPFFNRGTSDQNSEEAVSRFWLTLTTPVQTVSTVLVSYVQGATNAYDPGFDALFPSEVSDRFFTLNNDKEFLIQGRQFPLAVTDVVSLGMSHYADGNYTIALAEREGVFANGQNVYLRDKATGTVTNLSEGSYTYSAVHGISSDRFEIIYEQQTVLGADGTLKENIQVYRDGSDFVIKSPGKKITGIEVYDTSGKLILEEVGKQSEVRVSGAGWVNGIYILKIYSNGQVSTRKVLR